MVEYSKPRDAASQALIELRNKMGLTQAGLAIAYLKTAVTTVAKYETSHRPPTEMLLRLSEIANEHAPELAGQFKIFYLEDVLKAVGNQVTWIGNKESARGFVTASLSGDIAIRGAMHFLTLAERARCNPEANDDPAVKAAAKKLKEDAISAFSALQAAAEKGSDPLAISIRRALEPAPSAPATSGKPKGKTSKSRPKSSR
jgi:transcriptional regulator with XRE-family HTH domain